MGIFFFKVQIEIDEVSQHLICLKMKLSLQTWALFEIFQIMSWLNLTRQDKRTCEQKWNSENLSPKLLIG